MSLRKAELLQIIEMAIRYDEGKDSPRTIVQVDYLQKIKRHLKNENEKEAVKQIRIESESSLSQYPMGGHWFNRSIVLLDKWLLSTGLLNEHPMLFARLMAKLGNVPFEVFKDSILTDDSTGVPKRSVDEYRSKIGTVSYSALGYNNVGEGLRIHYVDYPGVMVIAFEYYEPDGLMFEYRSGGHAVYGGRAPTKYGEEALLEFEKTRLEYTLKHLTEQNSEEAMPVIREYHRIVVEQDLF